MLWCVILIYISNQNLVCIHICELYILQGENEKSHEQQMKEKELNRLY